jgi:hypothetical protein
MVAISTFYCNSQHANATQKWGGSISNQMQQKSAYVDPLSVTRHTGLQLSIPQTCLGEVPLKAHVAKRERAQVVSFMYLRLLQIHGIDWKRSFIHLHLMKSQTTFIYGRLNLRRNTLQSLIA